MIHAILLLALKMEFAELSTALLHVLIQNALVMKIVLHLRLASIKNVEILAEALVASTLCVMLSTIKLFVLVQEVLLGHLSNSVQRCKILCLVLNVQMTRSAQMTKHV